VSLPHTRWSPPHEHEGEWSVDCYPCLADYLDRRATEIRQGEEKSDGRRYSPAEALDAAAAELAAEYDQPVERFHTVVDDLLHP
jgi:hypothetical protein